MIKRKSTKLWTFGCPLCFISYHGTELNHTDVLHFIYLPHRFKHLQINIAELKTKQKNISFVKEARLHKEEGDRRREERGLI